MSSKKGQYVKRKAEKEDVIVEPVKEITPEPLQQTPSYNMLITEIPKYKSDMFKNDFDPTFARTIDFPRFDLGFHHWITMNKDKMADVEAEYEGRKKTYQVLNPFERKIDKYEDDIDSLCNKYFGIGGKEGKPMILSRGGFKLWEILMLLDVIPTNMSNFVSAHLAEGPGSFVQMVIFYRDLFTDSKHSPKNDKYYAITLHSESSKKNVPEMEENFIKFYSKESPQRFVLHKTYPKAISGGAIDKDNGDLTDPKTIRIFGGEMREKAHLVTADGGFEWDNENTQEQEAFPLIIGQILSALTLQKPGGNFVCKLFESYSMTTSKLIYLLNGVYDTVYLIKPYTSRPSNSEKYIVCKGFNPSEKTLDSLKRNLEKLLNILKEHPDIKLNNIFSSFELPQEYKNLLTYVNTYISNRQTVQISRIENFMNEQNNFGLTYQKAREKQILASQYWTGMFLPKSLSAGKQELNKLLTTSLQSSKDAIEKNYQATTEK